MRILSIIILSLFIFIWAVAALYGDNRLTIRLAVIFLILSLIPYIYILNK